MGSPLELIRYDTRSGRFEAVEQALAALEKVKGPVGVVAVSGRARQGKSYILNQILGHGHGFKVSPTHNTCTKGLWLWSTPIERTTIDGQSYSLVLLDTEGIVAYDQTGQYSTQIFCLAVLLSSLFIFNQMGGIDEDSLDQLSLVTEMSKHIKVRAGSGNSDVVNDLAQFTPAFIWLLRDFYLRLQEEDSRVITPKDYLEKALRAIPGDSSAAKSKNQIRESIKSLFPDRECITLVRPVMTESELAQLERLPKERLRPEFRAGVDELMNLIWAKAKIKMIGNSVVNGPRLAALARMYVDAINGGAVPTIATAWQGVEEQECRRAAEEAERAYVEVFNADIEGDVNELEREHQRAMLAAQKVFESIALGNSEAREAGDCKYRQALSWRFEQFRERKLAEAERNIDQRLYNETMKLRQIERRNDVTLDNVDEIVHAEIDQFLIDYDDNTVGPSKWPKLLEFMRNVYGGILQSIAEKQIADLQQQLQQAKTSAQQFEGYRTQMESERALKNQEILKLNEYCHKLQASSQQELQGSRAQLQTAAARTAQLEKQLQHVITEKEQQVVRIQQEAENKLQEYQNQQQQREHQQDVRFLEKQNELEELSRRVAAQDKLIQQSQQDANVQLTGLLQQLQSKEAQLEEAHKQMQLQVSALENLRKAAQKQSEKARSDLQQQEARFSQELERERQRAAQALEEANQFRIQIQENRNANGNGNAERVDPKSMTIQEIKNWLVERGYEAEVFQAAQNKVKKQEWINLMNSKQ